MKKISAYCFVVLLLLIVTTTSNSYGQILSYTGAADGSVNYVAANASGTGLSRVNGLQASNASCGSGFSSTNFSAVKTYSSALSAEEVRVTPSQGYSLNVTGFTTAYNRSSSGPTLSRLAYSTDGGTTWISQNSNDSTRSGACGKNYTVSWSTSVTVNSPATLIFRVYSFGAKKSSGTEQIANLVINGTVSSTQTSCGVTAGLSATNITSSSITLSWNAVSGATSYKIHYHVSGSATWTTTTSSTSSVSISGLTASTGYGFRVQTVCSGGTSAYSLPATFTTAAPSCSVPAGLSSGNITPSSATLSWTAVTGATSYNIHYRVSGSATWTNTTSSTSSVSISGLTASTAYEFQVQTVCSGGTSAYSSSATFTTIAPSCSVPAGLSSGNITTSSATLSWTAVSGATSYNIHYRVSGSTTWTTTTSSTSSVSISGLTASTAYEFQVQTVCSGGTSAYSSSATFTTTAPPCSVPAGLSSGNITSSSATLRWTAVSGATSYNIHYRISGSATWTTTTSSTSSVSISGLTASTAYEFQVQTVCSGGTSAYSSSATFTTLTATGTVPTPDHVVVLILENHGYSQIIGSSAAPHINALANDAASALFTQSYAIEHPSQPNYLDLYSGSNQGSTDDNVPSGTVQGDCSTIGTGAFTVTNLGKQLPGKSLSWATYSEDLPCTGFNGATSNNYARKHNPATNWQGSGTNQIPSSTNKPFSSFPTDFTQLPTVCYVVPNQNNDMHNGSDPSTITTGDNWMYNNLNNYIQWAKTHNSLFIVTFDEDDDAEGNHITTIFTGSMVAGGQYSNTINHYNVLRTIEDMYGLGYAGKASTVTTITNCWKSATLARLASSSTYINTMHVAVYPIPAATSINFKLYKVPTSRIWLKIYDMAGRLQGQYQFINSLNLRVNTNHLPAGNYYYRMIDDKTVLHSGTFIISR
jgi:hypothetical protein